MEHERDPRTVLLRAAVCASASLLAVLALRTAGARALDVGLWAVLAPLLTGAVLELAPRARQRAHVEALRRHRAPVVVPDAAAAHRRAPDTAVHAREAAVEHVRAQLVAARERGATAAELLVLARALHEARLDVARAALSAGGHVSQELRDELALRDRQAAADAARGLRVEAPRLVRLRHPADADGLGRRPQ